MPTDFEKRHWNQLPGDDQAQLLRLLVDAGLLDAQLCVTAPGERFLYTGRLDLPEVTTFAVPLFDFLPEPGYAGLP